MIGLLLASLMPMSPIPTPPLIYIALQKPVLLLYYSSRCPYSQKVLRYLHQIHKTVPMMNVENNPQAKDDLERVGGYLQVPCLAIDGRAVYDADAIIQWLSQNQSVLKDE